MSNSTLWIGMEEFPGIHIAFKTSFRDKTCLQWTTWVDTHILNIVNVGKKMKLISHSHVKSQLRTTCLAQTLVFKLWFRPFLQSTCWVQWCYSQVHCMNHRERNIFSVVSFGVVLFGSEGARCPYRNIKYVSSIITHQQMHQTYLLFKLCFNNSH
jgi:hypothetical protein